MKKNIGLKILLIIVVTLIIRIPLLASLESDNKKQYGLLGKRYVSIGKDVTISLNDFESRLALDVNIPVQKNIDILVASFWGGRNFLGVDLKSTIIYHFFKNSLFRPYVGGGVGRIKSEIVLDSILGIEIKSTKRPNICVNMYYSSDKRTLGGSTAFWLTDSISLSTGSKFSMKRTGSSSPTIFYVRATVLI
jgi:hypothetical protein